MVWFVIGLGLVLFGFKGILWLLALIAFLITLS